MKVPGVSLTLGMSQDTGTPYARVTGRKGGFVLGKRLDLDSQKGLFAIAAGLLLANAVKQSKKKAGKKKPEKTELQPSVDLGGFLSHFIK